jgi:hypothetical protein
MKQNLLKRHAHVHLIGVSCVGRLWRAAYTDSSSPDRRLPRPTAETDCRLIANTLGTTLLVLYLFHKNFYPGPNGKREHTLAVCVAHGTTCD